MNQEKSKQANKADETEQHFFEIIKVVAADKEIPDDLLSCPVCQEQLKVLVELGA